MAQASFPIQEPLHQPFDLLSGHSIPAVGLGTWKSGSDASSSVHNAIVEAAYRHIDTSWQYEIQPQRFESPSTVTPIYRWEWHSNLPCKQAQQAPQLCSCFTLCLPGWRNDKMLEACKKNGIHVTRMLVMMIPEAYSPLGSSGGGGRDLIHDQTVDRIAKKLNKSPEHVLVRWAIQRGTSVIPKSTKLERMRENASVFNWTIPEQDFKALSSIPDQRRVFDGEEQFANKSAGPLRSAADVWDHED